VTVWPHPLAPSPLAERGDLVRELALAIGICI
jgi:hypothetical protein